MFFVSKRKRIVRKALRRTVAQFRGKAPGLYKRLFYGPVDSAPQFLAVWYIFETDRDLETAESTGLCDEIRCLTVENLLALGYPGDALGADRVQTEGNLNVFNEKLLFDMRCHTAQICFTSHENIVRKADGDYKRYFH